MHVRPYRTEDRAGVRRVCFETGYMGDPVAWQWRDRESFADLFSGWYTDHAGADALVVVDGDGDRSEVLGYLLGCRDTRRVPGPGPPRCCGARWATWPPPRSAPDARPPAR